MKVLIAEDDSTSRRVLQIFLNKLGYDVVAAENGREALELLRGQDAPRLAILDWMMPEVSGLEVCQQIRKQGREPYTYILLLTARTQQGDIIAGLEAGADDYIAKPVELQELKGRLQTGCRILDLETQLIAAREGFRKQAMHDSLTGLLNHNAILSAAERELARARRDGTSVGLILGDLDDFKKVNDRWGHSAGDAVLKETANRLSTAVRSYDMVGRYGGEEFLIVMPGCKADTIWEQAERLRKTINGTAMVTPEGRVTTTMSLGALSSDIAGAQWNTDCLLRAVDKALYRAKNEGRNRVAVADNSLLVTDPALMTLRTSTARIAKLLGEVDGRRRNSPLVPAEEVFADLSPIAEAGGIRPEPPE